MGLKNELSTVTERPSAVSCRKCVLPSSFPGITFDEEGVCSFCREYERRWADFHETLPEKRKVLETLVEDAKRKKRPFDALVPLSGGKDSIYVLYLAVRKLGLRCLAYTMDNGYLTAHARENIRRACRALGVEHVTYAMDPDLMNRLFGLFMRKTGYFCSICMRCIGMTTELVAGMHDIPLVLGGSSARTELVLSREMFQPGPPAYVRNVLKGEELMPTAGYLLFDGTLKRRIGYRLFWWGSKKRIRICAWINLPEYMDWNYDELYRVIRSELGWRAPEKNEEHTDCGIHPVSEYLHNRRFPGLEIRRLTFARLIMAGQMTREEVVEKLENEPEKQCPEEVLNMFLRNIGLTRDEFDRLVDMGPRHLDYQPGESLLFRSARTAKKVLKRILRH